MRLLKKPLTTKDAKVLKNENEIAEDKLNLFLYSWKSPDLQKMQSKSIFHYLFDFTI